LPDRFKVGGKALDLLWKHRADGKDPAHAERLAEVSFGSRSVPHWISTNGWRPFGGILTAYGWHGGGFGKGGVLRWREANLLRWKRSAPSVDFTEEN
jgi:hypothetical protein